MSFISLLYKTLVFVDNTADLYAAMAKVEESEPEKLKEMPSYGAYMIDAFKELTQDDLGKEGLADFLTSVGGKVKFIIFDPSVSLSNYWTKESDALGIEIRSDSFGCWGGYYSAEYLEKLVTLPIEGVTISLTQRRSLKLVEGEIAAAMKKVSDAFGSELTWEPNYGKLWNWLVENSDAYSKENSYPLGNAIRDYVVFFSDTLTEFLGNADNKEAVQEKLTAKKLGFVYLPKTHPDYVNWAWDDGKLCLQIVGDRFGCWITTSYYSLENLEATL